MFHTPPKTNLEPKNEGLENYFLFQKGDFQVRVVSFRGSTQKVVNLFVSCGPVPAGVFTPISGSGWFFSKFDKSI